MDSNPSGNQNKFFGQKVSLPGININSASDSELLYKLDYDNSNQTFYGSTGTIQFGKLADGNLGMQTVDADGFVLFKLEGQTWYWYDKTTGKNIMQIGLLPDGTYGWAIADTGKDVADGISP